MVTIPRSVRAGFIRVGLEMNGRRGDDIVPSVSRAGRLGQGKLMAAGKPGDIAAALKGLLVGAEFFHANTRPMLAVGVLVVFAGIVVNLQVRVGELSRHRARRLEINLWPGEIVVRVQILPCMMASLGGPIV